MPIEIREVVIKAQLERKPFGQNNQGDLSEEKILQIKEEIMSAMMEKIEEKLWRTHDR